ncbi:Chaperonin-like RbcX protein 2 chloroplastic [Bienertia sinuspersici]
MVAFSLLSSPVIDSPLVCPCICLDTLNSSSMKNIKSGGGVGLSRISINKKQSKSRKIGSLSLSSSFVDPGKEFLGVMNYRSLRKRRKARNSVIVNELGGQYEDNFADVKTQILNYFTYKAARTVLNQLYEMNPPQYTWLYNYLVANKPGDGKVFIRKLGKKCDHAEMYQEISDENLELMRERLLETIIWPSDDTNTEKIG